MDLANTINALAQPEVAAMIGIIALAVSGIRKNEAGGESGIIILIVAALWAAMKYAPLK